MTLELLLTREPDEWSSDNDFLDNFGIIERSRLFDSTWSLSSQWVKVPVAHGDRAPTYGEVSCMYLFPFVIFPTDRHSLKDTIHVPEDTEAVIVLALLDNRYFKELSGLYDHNLSFTIYQREGAADDCDSVTAPLVDVGGSVHSMLWKRSTSLELKLLKKGDYVVHVSGRRHLYDDQLFIPRI